MKIVFTDLSKTVLVLWIIFVMFRVCHALSVHCTLVVTCWERANLLALLFVMIYFVFVTSPSGSGVELDCSLPPCLLLLCYTLSFPLKQEFAL